MDKLKPHYSLKEVKRAASEGRCTLTVTASQTAHSIGYSRSEVIDLVANLSSAEFYKSTTDFHNSAAWQDVYKKFTRGMHVYLKLKLIKRQEEEVLVLSFKEDETPGGAR